jgi:hypothetical protein
MTSVIEYLTKWKGELPESRGWGIGHTSEEGVRISVGRNWEYVTACVTYLEVINSKTDILLILAEQLIRELKDESGGF